MESVCVRCGLSVSQYADRWIKRIHSRSGATRDSIPRADRRRLKRQLYGLTDSPRSWQVHLNQVLKSLNLSQMKSDPCTFTGVDSKGHLNLMVMAYVDDLIVSGEAQAVQTFIQEIQKTFNLKHVDYLTVNSPVEFLGRVIKVKRSGQITMEFPQKLIDNWLGLFDVKGKSTTNGVKIHQVPKEDQVQCEKGMHSKFRTAIGKLLWMSQLRVMTSSSLSRNCQGHLSVEIVSFSDSDWAGCQRSRRRSTSGSLITLYSVNLSSTSRTQASVSHSSAEAKLYAMTQASVDSLAIKHFIKELKSEILSRDVKITLKTDSSAGKTMASRLGISKRSKHIELKMLWIQDILSEGVMSLEKVGTHHNPSDNVTDILTKLVQASVLGNHLPKLNLFRDSAVSQVFKVSSIVRVHGLQSHRESQVADQRLSRLHQVCAHHQGQVFMINFEALQGQQDLVVQRFKSASRRIQRAFAPPPPRRGSENQDSSHSDIQTQIQENQNHVIKNVAATSRWWAFIALIMSIMHFVVQGYQFSVAMFKRVKQLTIMLVNVNQVSVTIIAIINQRRRQGQRRSHTRLSGHKRQSRLQYLCTFILFSALFATCILIVLNFMSSNQSLSQSSCLTAVSNSVESFHSRVLHPLSASVVTFTSRMAASSQQTTTEAAAQVAQSLQSMSLMARMRSSRTILKFLSFVMHSVKWSQLRRIKSCNVSWSMSLSMFLKALQ